MQRTIISFDQDDEHHWRAILSCGHRQHVRHDPPLVSRPWVLTEDGRASRAGQTLNCVKCDRWIVVLQTQRLQLRRLEEEDIPSLVELDADPEVTRYVHLKQPTTPERAQEWLKTMAARFYVADSPFGFWAVVESNTGRFIGWFHLKPVEDDSSAGEIGYRLRRDAWGNGYATELSAAVIVDAFSRIGLNRILASALEANAASTCVMQKVGMTIARRFRFEGMPAVEYERLAARKPS